MQFDLKLLTESIPVCFQPRAISKTAEWIQLRESFHWNVSNYHN